ncbi:hypothetical protein EJ110_NYTH58833 [Nymphaea thermarum]|nr:hypothetical protein EJ110_NYTH58833 [Nymphaea thermarum]
MAVARGSTTAKACAVIFLRKPKQVVDSPNSEEQGISNSDDGYMGGCQQHYEPAYSNIHDSFQGSYLNMPNNITLGNQVNHFSQGHVIPCYPSFPTNRAENISANQEVLESVARHLFCEPLVSESCNNQSQQMIMGMNSLSSLIGASGASMNASQQGDCYPLYQIVTENPDATGTLSSDTHIVPSSWGTSSHLVESMPGVELQNNLSKVPHFFRETNPQPRKHTLWQAANDFTGGQAVTYRLRSEKRLEPYMHVQMVTGYGN